MTASSATQTLTVADIRDRLDARYDGNEWMRFHELRECAGFNAGTGIRTIDFAALHKWSSKNHSLICVEIKMTRSDFRRELERPEKSSSWREMANEFWFAAPRGVVDPAELPVGTGLLETHGDGLRKTRAAAFNRCAPGPNPDTFVMMLRHQQSSYEPRIRELKHLNAEFAEFKGRSISIDDLRRLALKYGALDRTKRDVESAVRLEAMDARRKSNLKYAQWAKVEQEWRRVVGSIWDEPTPEVCLQAMKVMSNVRAMRTLAAAIVDAIPGLEEAAS